MPVRRYDINLIIQQQTNPPAPPPPPNPNTPAPPGSPSSLDQLARYAIGIGGIRMAWQQAKAAVDDYVSAQERLSDNQKSAADKAADYQRNMRQYLRNEGVFLDPSKRAEAMQRAEDFGRKSGFANDRETISFLTKWSSDVTQYAGRLYSSDDDKKLMGWVARSSVLSGTDSESAVRAASAVVGSTDWRRFGPKAAENAYSKYERIIEILSQGKGDIKLNMKNFSRFANEMIAVNRSEGRITGEDALEKAAILMREVSEYNPDEAEVFGRNSVEMMRQFGKTSVAKHLKKAGISYEDPVDAMRKLNLYYEAQKKAGKIPEGETLIDFMRNAMKGNIRSSAGVYATVNAEAKGLGEAAMQRASIITPDNVEKLLGSMEQGDRVVAIDKARQAAGAEARAMGEKTFGLEEMKSAAGALFMSRGYGGLNDPNSPARMGWMRYLNPWAGNWDYFDAESMRGDEANKMLYTELVRRNRPGMAGRVAGMGGMGQMSHADVAASNFYMADKTTRDRMLMTEAAAYESGGKSVRELLQELIDVARSQNNQGKPAVPLAPQQPGMVRP